MGTFLIRSPRSAAWLAAPPTLVFRWGSCQTLPPGSLWCQKLYPPTGRFPPSRLGKALSFLAGFRLLPGQGFVLVTVSCVAVLGGPERGSVLQSDLPTGVDETGPAHGPGQREQRAVPGPSRGHSQSCFSPSDLPSPVLAGPVLPVPCAISSPSTLVSRCGLLHLFRCCCCPFCS